MVIGIVSPAWATPSGGLTSAARRRRQPADVADVAVGEHVELRVDRRRRAVGAQHRRRIDRPRSNTDGPKARAGTDRCCPAPRARRSRAAAPNSADRPDTSRRAARRSGRRARTRRGRATSWPRPLSMMPCPVSGSGSVAASAISCAERIGDAVELRARRAHAARRHRVGDGVGGVLAVLVIAEERRAARVEPSRFTFVVGGGKNTTCVLAFPIICPLDTSMRRQAGELRVADDRRRRRRQHDEPLGRAGADAVLAHRRHPIVGRQHPIEEVDDLGAERPRRPARRPSTPRAPSVPARS